VPASHLSAVSTPSPTERLDICRLPFPRPRPRQFERCFRRLRLGTLRSLDRVRQSASAADFESPRNGFEILLNTGRSTGSASSPAKPLAISALAWKQTLLPGSALPRRPLHPRKHRFAGKTKAAPLPPLLARRRTLLWRLKRFDETARVFEWILKLNPPDNPRRARTAR